MYTNSLSIEAVNVWLTIIASLVVFTVVCVPMNSRPLSERLFVLFIGISTLGASLDRVAKIWSAYDIDGSVTFVANVVVMLSRFGLSISGMFVVVHFLQKRRANVESINRFADKYPNLHANIASH